jgi:Holliday junction resolvasome RuvABC DNA-binding subunit
LTATAKLPLWLAAEHLHRQRESFHVHGEQHPLLDRVGAAGRPRDALVARDALVELGYSVVEAERALAEVDPGLPAEERVRLALKAA